MQFTKIYIESEELPTLSEGGYVVTANKIWSENTGRSTITGLLTGDIITIKNTIDLSWELLYEEDLKKILDLLSNKQNPFFSVKYYYKGNYLTGSFYASDLTYTLFKYVNGRAIYKDISVSLIEQ